MLALIVAASASAPASALATGTIAGTITDETTGDPIEDICVQMFAVNGNSPEEIPYTDTLGHYEKTGLAAGPYQLSIRPCWGGNFIKEVYDEASTLNDATPVNVVDGQTTVIDEQLRPGGTISGTVVSAAANPIQGVCVHAQTPGGILAGTSVRTDANGEYTLKGLDEGSYRVGFSGLCSSAAPNVVTEYWDDQPDLASADPVVVSPTQSPTGIDATMQPGAGISGTVTEQTGGAPVNHFCARAQELDGDFVGRTFYTDASGDYEIKALPPGDYKVQFTPCVIPMNLLPEYWDGKDTFAAGDVVAVASATTTTGINASLRTSGSISGHVSSDIPGGALDGICVYAQGIATNKFQADETDSSGDYEVIGLPTDDYKVRFEACHGQPYRPEHYDNKTTSVGADPVVVAAGNATTSINAELTFDDVPPDTTIVSGPVGITAATVAGFALAADGDAVKGECRLDGGTWETCLNAVGYTAVVYTGLSTGSHTFDARAIDSAGNKDLTPASRTWTVDPNATTSTTIATVPPGGQAKTDPTGAGPSPSEPMTTAVTSPTGGTVTITQNSAPTQPAPSGFQLFGKEIVITAPPASIGTPIRLTFRVDASAIPAGTDLQTVAVVRDGVLARDCINGSTADPDPCVLTRDDPGDGDIAITILTSHASTWSVVRMAPSTIPPVITPTLCATAKQALKQAKGKVKAAKKKIAKAKKAGNAKRIKQAKRKLKAAKKKLDKAEHEVDRSCGA